MADEQFQLDETKILRRDFMRDAAAAVAVGAVSPNLLLGCQKRSVDAASASMNVDAMDQALEMMAHLAPLTNHGPMAAEALGTLGRADAIVSFVERYKKRFTSSYPEQRQTITRDNWREALGDGSRVADWTSFFRRELKEAAWPQVLERWSGILAPGLAAAAAHGLIRTGHAVRSLAVKETELRRRELAEGLGYWAAYYQPLPETQTTGANFKPIEAINRVPLLPDEKRARGSIMIAMRSLSNFSPFAGVANLVQPTQNPERFLSEVTETFATAYVRNVTQRNFVTLIHGVTGTAALRSLLPYLSSAVTQKMLRYGWQMAAGLYSISATGSTNRPLEPTDIKHDYLIDRAVALNEEHAIKFTEACLREFALNPKPDYLLAARDALERISPV